MGAKSSLITKLLTDCRGSFQLFSLTRLTSILILTISVYQNAGLVIYQNQMYDGLSELGIFLSGSSFLHLFKHLIPSDSFPFIFTVQIIYFICFFLKFIDIFGDLIFCKFRTSNSYKSHSNEYQKTTMNFFSQVFIHIFAVPILEIAVVSLSCGSVSTDYTFHNLNVIQSGFCNSSTPMLKTASFIISIFNLIGLFFEIIISIIYTLPRNFISENFLSNQSRELDGLLAIQKLFLGFSFLIAIIKSQFTSIIFILIQLLMSVFILHKCRFTITFCKISTLRFFVKSQLFYLQFIIFQLIRLFFFQNKQNLSINLMQVCVLLVSFYFLSCQLERVYFMSIFNEDISSTHFDPNELFLCLLAYRYAKENSHRGFIFNDKKSFPDLEKLNLFLLRHFLACENSEVCFCAILKKGGEFWDKQEKKKLACPTITNGAESLVRFVCSLSFIKLLLVFRVEAAIKRGRGNLATLHWHLKFIIFEELDLLSASQILQTLGSLNQNFLLKLDYQFLRNSFLKQAKTHFNHHNYKCEFLNSEKLVKISDYLAHLQNCFIDVLDVFVHFLTILSTPNKTNDKKFKIIKYRIKKLSHKMEHIKELFQDIPKNFKIYRLCSLFAFHFCQDKCADHFIKLKIQKKIARFEKSKVFSGGLIFKCSKIKFYFNERDSAVLKIEMSSKPPGKILFTNGSCAKFFGCTPIELQSKTIHDFMTKNIATRHFSFYSDYLQGAVSRKILSNSVTHIKEASGFLVRRRMSIKPFFSPDSLQIYYLAFIEAIESLNKSSFLLDKFGFFEGVTQELHDFFDMEEFSSKPLRCLSIFLFIPDLLNFFFLHSPHFRANFEEESGDGKEKFLPFEEFDKENESNLICKMRKPSYATFNFFEELLQKLFGTQTKPNFAQFRYEVFKLDSSQNNWSTLQFQISKRKCGYKDLFFSFLIICKSGSGKLLIDSEKLVNLNESSDSSGESLGSYSDEKVNRKARLSIIIDQGLLLLKGIENKSGSQLSKKSKGTFSGFQNNNYLESGRSSDESQISLKSKNDFSKQLSVSKKIIDLDYSSVKNINGPSTTKLRANFGPSYCGLEKNVEMSLPLFTVEIKKQLGEINEEQFPVKVESLSNKPEILSDEILNLKKDQEFLIEKDCFTKNNSETFQSHNNKKMIFRAVFSEHEIKLLKLKETKRNKKRHIIYLVLLLLIPILYCAVLIYTSNYFFVSRIINIKTSNAGAYFFSTLSQGALQLLLMIKNIKLTNNPTVLSFLKVSLGLLASDFEVANVFIFEEIFDQTLTADYYIINNIYPYFNIMYSTLQASDNSVLNKLTQFDNSTNIKKLYSDLANVPVLQQNLEKLYFVTLTYAIITAIFLVLMIIVVFHKSKLANKNRKRRKR